MRDKSGRISRRGTVGFVDYENSKKPICIKCEEEGFDSRANMVPYIMDDGRPDPAFLRCRTCGAVFPIRELKYESELEDMINVEEANKPTRFVGLDSRRGFQMNVDSYQPDEIPNLGNKPDKELESLLKDRPGIVTYIIDGNNEEEEY